MTATKTQSFYHIHLDTFHPEETEVVYSGVANITQGIDEYGDPVDEVDILELYRDGVEVKCFGSGRDWDRFLGVMRQAARDKLYMDSLKAETLPVKVTVYDIV